MVMFVEPTWLAELIETSAASTLILDARTADQNNRGCIQTSVHIHCEGMILRRLKKGTLKIETLLGWDEDKAKYAAAKTSEDVTIVICDQNSERVESLAAESLAALLLKKISCECKHVAFLQGGYDLFSRLHSELCCFPHSTSDMLQKRPSSLALQLNTLSLSTEAESTSFTELPKNLFLRENSSEVVEPFEILPHLYLGCRKIAMCLPGLKDNRITRILNVTSTIPNHFQHEGFTYQQIAVEDSLDVDLMQHLEVAFQFIEEARACGEKVLVHCHAGRSRSVTIVLAYLIKFFNYSLHSALEYVKQRKPDVNPNLSFMGQLLDYEECTSRPSPADSGLGSSPVEGHYLMPSPPSSLSSTPLSFHMDL